jgi:sporulation protein YlmC with PRC-barrel domain
MKRTIPGSLTAAAVAALLTLGSAGAWAQSSMSAPGGAPSSRSAAPGGAAANSGNAPSATNSAPMKNPLASEDISQISGSSVAGSDGSKIGTISTALMDPESKKVDRLVVAEGGVLGVGAHRVALPVDSFRWDAQNHNFVIQKTADDLKAMPEWQQPQLAENPNGSSTQNSGSTHETSTPRTTGAAGTSTGAPAGASMAPGVPSSSGGTNR